MAQIFIPVDITQNSGADFINLKEQLRHVADNFAWHKAQMDNNVLAPGTLASDYVDVETQWGIPTGEGQAVYNMVTTLLVQLAVADVQSLFNQVGKT